MLGALDVHRALLMRDVDHEIVRLTRPVTDADELPAVLGLDPAVCVAVRVYALTGATTLTREPTLTQPPAPAREAAQWVAVAVRAGCVPDPVLLLRATGATSLRAAGAAEVNAVTGSAAGLVPPVALPPGVPLLVDARLGVPPVLYAATGEGWTALGISARDLLLRTGATVATLTRDQPDLDALLGGVALDPLLSEVAARPVPVPALPSAGVRRPSSR